MNRKLALLLFCATTLTGCVRARAKTLPEVPLDMPAPPPRIVEVTVPVSPVIVSLPEEPVRITPPRAAPPARTEARPAEQRSEAPAETPRDDPSKAVAAPILQTAPASQESEAEARIRALLRQATGDLGRINVPSLGADARLQYETARRFAHQAEDALRAKNLVFAANLADKASALAARLAGR
jgi:hypothetical protein